MHIGLLYHADTVGMTAASGSIMGRSVANEGFLKALLATNAALTFFVSSAVESELLAQTYPELQTRTQTHIVTYQEAPAILAKNPPDILHVPGPELYRGLALRKLASQPIPVTGITHTISHDPFLSWLTLSLQQLPQDYDALFCTTPTAKLTLERMQTLISPTLTGQPKLNLREQALGIDLSAFAKKSTLSARTQLGLGPNTPMILSLGRFSYYTKMDLMPLLYAHKDLISRGHEAVLVLAGAAGQESFAELLELTASELGLSAHVKFVTNPNEELKLALLQACDIFVAFSDNPQETFGLSVVEAMACGKPVVCSDWDGYKALIEHGRTGLRLPTQQLASNPIVDRTALLQLDSLNHLFFSQSVAIDLLATADAFDALIRSPEIRISMGEAAREASKHYDWSVIMTQFFASWQELSLQAKKRSMAPMGPQFSYAEIFSAYPTKLIDDNTQFKATVLGQDILAGRVPFRSYLAMKEISDIYLMVGIIRTTSLALALGALKTHFKDSHQPERVAYHAAYLTKYGMLEIVG